MKYFKRMLLLPCLLIGLTSCAVLPKTKAKSKAQLEPIAMAKADSSRRQIGEDAKNKEEKGSQRRTVSKPSGIEKVTKSEKKEEKGPEQIQQEKSVTIFEPYDPEKKAEKEEIKAEGELPQEIKEELLGIKEEEEEYVTLNFEQAPIEQILNAVSETLGINFIMTPGVKGAITMQTSKSVPASELFQILQSVLEVNGLTLVQSGRYYKLVFGKEAKQYPLQVLSGKEGEDLPPEDSFITQIIPLDYIPVNDMINILQPFLSKSAPPMIRHEELNILIINDLASNMRRLLRFVQELDKPLYQPKEKVYVYYVENGDADKLANTLNSIYKNTDKSKRFPSTPVAREKAEQEQPQLQPQQIVQTPFGPFIPQEQVSGEVSITADKEINALIIVTSPRDYPAVLETIKKLDIMPKQALIEALVVDVTLTDNTEFGIGWYLRGHEQVIGSNLADVDLSFPSADNMPLKSVMGPERFSNIFGYKLITESRHLVAFMKQLNEITDVKVISSPYIISLDNQKASMHITRRHPVPKETVNKETGETERDFTYVDAGLKLDVTPKINESNLITLELEQEVSEIVGIVEGGGVIKDERTANSKVVVRDGQTIIIGGLIQNKSNKSKIGIPILSDIPVIGKLFGKSIDKIDKTELLLFITPHIFDTKEEADQMTENFEKKVETIKELTSKPVAE